MPLRLNSEDSDFGAAFAVLVAARRESDPDISREVAAIIADVRGRGDEALAEYTRRFDGFDLDATGWRIETEECVAAYRGLDERLRSALDLAARRIADYHQRLKPENHGWTDTAGVSLGYRWEPIETAGVYVPGGRAAYPSSVLMNAIPARVAGVGRLVMTTPTPGGEVNPSVLAAAHIVGVDEIWRVGGAQAVAALAHGTDRIAPVDIITGPGNAWVAEAKRQLFGRVGIDMVAGPSEILVVADGDNDPDWIAADLLSQAEHDPTSQSVLMTDDASFADRVATAVDAQLASLPTASVARESWEAHGAIIVLASLDDAPALVDQLAPEHLELAVAHPDPLFGQIRHAGSVFLGRWTPEAMGDYIAGPNHVLPTGRRARFASGLSVTDFMKRTSYIGLGEISMKALGHAALALAEAEGLPAHAHSIALRLGWKR